MNGGAGNDSFVFNAGFGHDTLAAFGDAAGNQDIIDVSTAIFANFAAVQAHMTQQGANVLITVDAANDILVQGITLANLGADDFRFH